MAASLVLYNFFDDLGVSVAAANSLLRRLGVVDTKVVFNLEKEF